jgi:hypothetical protein
MSLGPANEQTNLNEAAAAVCDGRPVIVVRVSKEQHGHVAMTLPGPLTRSTSWSLDVPNSRIVCSL